VLISRFGLGAAEAARLGAVLEVIEDDEHAPTSVRDAATALDVHVADSLTALAIEGIRSAQRITDLGSGAGFPGLALAIALPYAEVALVESQRRKCEFLQRLAATAGADNARVVVGRAEQWAEGIGWADAVTARALAPQPVVLEYAAPLLRLGGVLVDWRGARDVDEELAAAAAAHELGLELREIRWVEPYAGARDHHLHVFAKREATPERFPRRPGIARKRPLGA